ncbi:MAG TPA: fluoride efflux transporter CrcB [Gemmatimonadales bacterium]|nr:fluoride efflux transporter CrcB [Gemmatimonadales bacterium]
MLWLYVALGGALGSLARYGLGALIQGWSGSNFPTGTLVVNVSAAFLIGAILQYSLETTSVSPETRLFLVTGFCGGYSTFSTFTWESVRLLQDGEWTRAGAYLLLSVIVGLAATLLGIAAGHQLILLRRA